MKNSLSAAHLNIDGDIYQSAANQSYWLTTESGETLLQDFGHFTTATADIISPPLDCNCINVARSVSVSQSLLVDLLMIDYND